MQMDPRTFTVKQCQPAYMQKSGGSIGSATSVRRDFFNSIGKIGDLEVLNSIGAGKIGAGLRTLASISNSIRGGTGAIPTSIGSSIDAGANWVLQVTGIGPAVISTLKDFNPGVANQAYGQAKVVYDMVKAGRFKFNNIPDILQDLQNLERLGSRIFTPGSNDVQTSLGERCDASPYAVDLISRAPKYKFLFVVQFIPEDGYGELATNGNSPLDMAFTVKKSSRPGMKFVTEDVNYYNYRTSVITRSEFDEMTMSFHDDNNNIATRFYQAYTRAMSPITGIRPEESWPDMLEESGMDFAGRTLTPGEIEGRIGASTYAASSGTLANDRKQVFKEIRLYHIFDNGHQMNVWSFLNPRITTIKQDELDMSVGSDGSELSINFVYDSVYCDPGVSLASPNKYNITEATQGGAYYPLRYNGIPQTVAQLPQVQPFRSPPSPRTPGYFPEGESTRANGFGDMLGLLTKIPQKISNIVSKANSAVAAVSDLGSKFSSAIKSFPFG